MEDFIHSFLILLGEEGKIQDLTVSKQIIKDIVESNSDFNHISLRYEDMEWLFPLPNHVIREVKIKTVNIKEYC